MLRPVIALSPNQPPFDYEQFQFSDPQSRAISLAGQNIKVASLMAPKATKQHQRKLDVLA